MQDTYITQLFLEAGRRPFELIKSEKQPWNDPRKPGKPGKN
jgi:hypothetical protein